VEPAGGPNPEAVPQGPEVDFCPTPEQVEEHFKLYGFDYKPTVSCTREGEVKPAGQLLPDDPDEALSDKEACEREKDLLLSAVPLRLHDHNPRTLYGRLPDGREIIVGIMGEVEKGRSIRDEASLLGC
jgi:hypothetical protein